jgi:hypothetical protein
MAIPTDAAMGRFVADAPILSQPDLGGTTGLTITAGKTYLVVGQDASGGFRKIVLACQFVWVPFNSVVPEPDSPWFGHPLPTTVVK